MFELQLSDFFPDNGEDMQYNRLLSWFDELFSVDKNNHIRDSSVLGSGNIVQPIRTRHPDIC